MQRSNPLRSITAICLLALFGVLGTGLPSHHHAAPGQDQGEGLQLVSADHHSHGTELVEQDERTPSSGLQIAPAPQTGLDFSAPTEHAVTAYDAGPLRPMERAPPPGAPRAPPAV